MIRGLSRVWFKGLQGLGLKFGDSHGRGGNIPPKIMKLSTPRGWAHRRVLLEVSWVAITAGYSSMTAVPLSGLGVKTNYRFVSSSLRYTQPT